MPGSIRLSICAGMVVEELTRDGRSSEAAAIQLRAQMEKGMGLKDLDRKFCIAPMMEWTDRHCRFFHRLLTRRALIYTEMITTGAVLHGPRARLLAHDPAEHPVSLQLGGCDPRQLAECARIAEAFGYDEVNLNAGQHPTFHLRRYGRRRVNA
jgi:hypothetical protein